MTAAKGRQGRPPELDDRKWLRRAYICECRSARSIAEEIGCTDRMVLAALHRLDIPTRPRRPAAPAELANRDLLYVLYWQKCMSINAIGAELGCSAGAVRRALHRHGIPVRLSGPARIEQLYDDAWLRKARSERTAAEIAAELACSEVTVRWALWRSRIPAGAGTPPRPPELDDVSFLLREYVDEKRSATAIGREIGCTPATVVKAIRRHGLAVRTPTRQSELARSQGRVGD